MRKYWALVSRRLAVRREAEEFLGDQAVGFEPALGRQVAGDRQAVGGAAPSFEHVIDPVELQAAVRRQAAEQLRRVVDTVVDADEGGGAEIGKGRVGEA